MSGFSGQAFKYSIVAFHFTGLGDARGMSLKISQNLLQVSLLMGVNVQDSSCQRSRCEGELRRAHLSRLSSLIFRHIVLRSVSSRMLSMSVRMFGGTVYAAFWSSWGMSCHMLSKSLGGKSLIHSSVYLENCSVPISAINCRGLSECAWLCRRYDRRSLCLGRDRERSRYWAGEGCQVPGGGS